MRVVLIGDGSLHVGELSSAAGLCLMQVACVECFRSSASKLELRTLLTRGTFVRATACATKCC